MKLANYTTFPDIGIEQFQFVYLKKYRGGIIFPHCLQRFVESEKNIFGSVGSYEPDFTFLCLG